MAGPALYGFHPADHPAGRYGVLSRHAGFIYRFPYADKLGHFVLYGILALLLDLALLIGLEEFSQQLFAHRTFDLVDLAFSCLRVFFFSWVAVKMGMISSEMIVENR